MPRHARGRTGASIGVLALRRCRAARAGQRRGDLIDRIRQSVNDTPEKLIPCIRTADLWGYMQHFQAIANANLGADGHPSRNSGEPGYKASVDYVANLMKAAGYNVTIQTYHFDYFSFVGTPQFSEVSPTPHDYALNSEWDPGRSSGTATNAQVQPAAGIVDPPDPNGSTRRVVAPRATSPASPRGTSH